MDYGLWTSYGLTVECFLRFAVSRVLTCETVLEVGEVSVEDTDDLEGTEEVGEDSTLYCTSVHCTL